MPDRYWGKFEGVVVDNDDPSGLCRLDVHVPSVLSQSTGWCRPSLPYAGNGSGFALVPPVGATVWVEWPGGDLGKPPVWSGAAWTSGNGIDGAGPGKILLVSPKGHRVEISDDDQSITLKAAGGASLTINADGIVLDNGQGATVELTGATVALNGESFKVG
ncbi:phage baseplate assembly protein V [Micromonospora sp. DR5-3]|uniref:phage baseplate assembly protein V n=1 Tax=unclassified Micromonospora TaxID=2617518 RepID=UPI0011DAA871|nr:MULTISPECIES: phage baseplate assembly protein V [unclassified Micromonospora]MCW3819204.1 phage baseplate assembly protein V [Micromonospora sp. DR5-3]TYC20734.1 baseplate assembly protein [Micromonospora sp. MP36]